MFDRDNFDLFGVFLVVVFAIFCVTSTGSFDSSSIRLISSAVAISAMMFAPALPVLTSKKDCLAKIESSYSSCSCCNYSSLAT